MRRGAGISELLHDMHDLKKSLLATFALFLTSIQGPLLKHSDKFVSALTISHYHVAPASAVKPRGCHSPLMTTQDLRPYSPKGLK